MLEACWRGLNKEVDKVEVVKIVGGIWAKNLGKQRWVFGAKYGEVDMGLGQSRTGYARHWLELQQVLQFKVDGAARS